MVEPPTTVRVSRRTEADLVAHIAEVDERKLYAREAAPSMFAYCTEVLHLSEHEAYLRITTARASREHPMLLTMLRDGRLHLSGVALLARHLTRENRDEILRRAVRLPHRRIKELAAELAPRADVLAIHTSAAEAVEGVEAVLTAADVPGALRTGLIHKDWPLFIPVGGRTSYLGDVLAVVVAVDRPTARRAAALVEVDYDVLTPVTNPVEAVAGGEDAV